MNMKRSLLLSLFAVAIVAMTFGQALATVDLQLNLRYTNPADQSMGGGWDLLAQTSDVDGIAGVVAVINNINLAGITSNNTTLTWGVFESQSIGAAVEIVLGDDMTSLAAGIGTPTGLGNVAVDDLGNAAWNNSALLASGTFGATRPSFKLTGGAGESITAANEIQTGAAVAATIGVTSVRGDGVATDLLLPGDADRNRVVNTTDLTLILNNFFGSVSGWDNGDVAGNDGIVNTADLTDVLNNFFGTSPAPPLAAVPEPASIALFASALALGLFRRR
jgi:hypothetical protein